MAVQMTSIDAFQQMFSNSSDALRGTQAQITELTARIEGRQNEISHIDAQIETQAQLCSDVEADIAKARKKLRQLKASARVAEGTGLEVSTSEDVTRAEADLKFQEELLASHQANLAAARKKFAKEKSRVLVSIDKLEAELQALREQEQELIQVYNRAHADLGRSLYGALAQEVETSLQSEAELKEALHELRSERLALQASLPQRLQAWPDLAKRAKELDDAVAPEPKVSPSIQLAEAAIAYLRMLAQHAPSIEVPRGFNAGQAEQLLAVPLDLVHRAQFDPQRIALLADRIKSLDEFKRQTEMMLNDRQIYASIHQR